MIPVTTVARVFEAVQAAKADGGAFCTNFFPTQAKLQAWIDHGELFGEVRGGSAFFARKDRDFWHLYFCTPDLSTLQTEFGALTSLKTERVAVDVVGTDANVGDLTGLIVSLGFRPHVRLIRLARNVQARQLQPSPEDTVVGWAQRTDHQAVMDLLERYFDRYADQLPMPYEIEAAIEARQILIVSCDGALAALLFFETQGLTSTIRYWVVAERFRSHRFGSALIRHYFASQSAVRRFILWVSAANDDAVLKYRHYGYHPDGLIDQVLLNELIRA